MLSASNKLQAASIMIGPQYSLNLARPTENIATKQLKVFVNNIIKCAIKNWYVYESVNVISTKKWNKHVFANAFFSAVDKQLLKLLATVICEFYL